jgi:hypothetical protein
MKTVMRFFAVGALVVLLVCSCLSMSATNNPVNNEFASQTGARLTFILRGLYSTAYEDARIETIYKKLAGDKLLFYVDAGQTETAVFSNDNDITAITFSQFIFELPEAERSIFVTAVAGAVGLIEHDPASADNGGAAAMFYKVIDTYNESGYDLAGINANEKIQARQITAFEKGLR